MTMGGKVVIDIGIADSLIEVAEVARCLYFACGCANGAECGSCDAAASADSGYATLFNHILSKRFFRGAHTKTNRATNIIH